MAHRRKRHQSKPSGVPSAGLKNVAQWIELRDVDRFMSEGELARRLADLEWSSAFTRLAFYSAFLANNSNPFVKLRAFLHGELIRSTVAEHRRAGEALISLHASRPIAHGAVINLLQANVILHGGDSGHIATDADLAYLLLAANAFAAEWTQATEEAAVTNKERNLANTARGMLYARGADGVHTLLRAFDVFKTIPPRTSGWNDAQSWKAVQEQALGCSLEDYLETLAVPLVLQTTVWAREGLEGAATAPQIRPEVWLRGTQLPTSVGEAFLGSLAVDRAGAREELEAQRGSHDIVVAPTLFTRRPLVWINNTHVVAANPCFVEDQIRMGIWARFLQHARLKHGAVEKWTSAFGDMFELRCRRFVERALQARARPGLRLVPSELWGKDEDIVLIEGNAIVVISVKASTIPEDRLKGARSIPAVVEWYERFYFGERSGHRRAGAIRLLQKKIDEIRAQPDAFPRRPTIYPVVLTYDRLSADNPGAYLWITARCNEEKLLPKCQPIMLLDIDDFEMLMAVVVRGASLQSLLATKAGDEWRYGRLSLLIHERFRAEEKRLPWAETEYDAIVTRIKQRLFGQGPASDPDPRAHVTGEWRDD